MWWGLGVNSWNDLIVLFVVIGGGFAVLAAGSIYVAFQLQKQVTADGAVALERFKAQAGRDIANANARAKEAELALEKYRTGRSFTADQRQKLEGSLRASPQGRVIVKPNYLSPEPSRYAKEIIALFNDAGFSKVGDAPLGIVSLNRPGLFVAVRDPHHLPPHAMPITVAFTNAGIPFETLNADWVPDGETVVILVGERP